MANHAIVFGASGLLGWSVVNQLLSEHAGPAPFARVTAVIHRPVAEADLYWPKGPPGQPALDVVSGVDLRAGATDGADLAAVLRGRVPAVKGVTHAFYFVFQAVNEDHVQESSLNCSMMQRVASALNMVAPRLKSIVYSGGTRGYGIYTPGGLFTAPLQESMAEQLPEAQAKTVAYPRFRQILDEARRGRDWTWTEVCPDAVIGFSPRGSAFSLALLWAQYLSLYAHIHGVRHPSDSPGGAGDEGKSTSEYPRTKKRVEVPFPGTQAGADALLSPVSERTLGRASIHAALNPQRCAGKVINIADQASPVSLGQLWAIAADWFGLEGVVGPSSSTDDQGQVRPSQYIAAHRHLFQDEGRDKAVTCGVGVGAAQMDSVGWWLTFDRQLSLDRLRASGFAEERSPAAGWIDALERFRAAGIIF